MADFDVTISKLDIQDVAMDLDEVGSGVKMLGNVIAKDVDVTELDFEETKFEIGTSDCDEGLDKSTLSFDEVTTISSVDTVV